MKREKRRGMESECERERERERERESENVKRIRNIPNIIYF